MLEVESEQGVLAMMLMGWVSTSKDGGKDVFVRGQFLKYCKWPT